MYLIKEHSSCKLKTYRFSALDFDKIGEYAFYNCSNLTKVPNNTSASVYVDPLTSVTSIKEKAFANCSSLTDLKIESLSCNISSDSLDNCSSLVNVYVPKQTYSNYKKAHNWKHYSHILRGYPYPVSASLSVSGEPYAENKDVTISGTVTYNDSTAEDITVANWQAPGIQNFGYVENNNPPVFDSNTYNVNSTLDWEERTDLEFIVDFQANSIADSCFYNNTVIRFAAFKNAASIGVNAFVGCSNLEKLFLGYDGMVSLTDVSYLPSSVQIIVPNNRLADYTMDPVWSTIQDKISTYDDSAIYPKYIKKVNIGEQNINEAPNLSFIVVNSDNSESTVTPTFTNPKTWQVKGDQSVDAYYNIGFRFVKAHLDNVFVGPASPEILLDNFNITTDVTSLAFAN